MESTRRARNAGERSFLCALAVVSSVCGACSANPFGDEGGADGGVDASVGGGGTGGGSNPGAPHTGAFVHPGILVSGPQLAFLKAQIAAGAEPWTSALAAAKK